MSATPVDGAALPPAQPSPQAPRIEVVFSMRTVVLGLAILLGIVLVVVVKDALLSIALAGVMVLGLDPPVSALERRGWSRGLAALAVLAAITLVVFVIVVWAVKPIWDDVGAILAVPVAASVKIIVREVTEGRRARMAALREPVVAEMA